MFSSIGAYTCAKKHDYTVGVYQVAEERKEKKVAEELSVPWSILVRHLAYSSIAITDTSHSTNCRLVLSKILTMELRTLKGIAAALYFWAGPAHETQAIKMSPIPWGTFCYLSS